MKFYQLDGSSVDRRDDTDFGWYLSELLEEECEKKINLETVKVSPVAFVEETIVVEKLQEDTNIEDLVSIDSLVPSKNQLTALIDFESAESKALLSVIHYSRYKLIAGNGQKTGEDWDCDGKKPSGVMSELMAGNADFCANGTSRCDRKTSGQSLQLYNEIETLKLDFQLEDSRCRRLKAEARKLAEDLRETAHLDRILYLLSGKPDKVRLANWPFKICHPKRRKDVHNLIV